VFVPIPTILNRSCTRTNRLAFNKVSRQLYLCCSRPSSHLDMKVSYHGWPKIGAKPKTYSNLDLDAEYWKRLEAICMNSKEVLQFAQLQSRWLESLDVRMTGRKLCQYIFTHRILNFTVPMTSKNPTHNEQLDLT